MRGLLGEPRKHGGETMEENKNKIRLLMVDDELEFLEATSRALSRRGFEVSGAEDGETALKELSQKAIDVVVLDVKMPGMDGVDCFRQIKLLFPQIPVVLLTGHGNIQQAFETSKEGVVEYLTKPCEVEKLAEVARRVALEGRRFIAASIRPDPDEEVRLLLVDDEPELLVSLADTLGRRGIRTDTALRAEAALALLDRQNYDVALIDAKLPGMDGLSLIRRIKTIQPDVEILVLTGHPSMNLALEGLKAGAIDFLMKPQSPDVLATKIHNAWRLRQMRLKHQEKLRLEKILSQKSD